MNERTGEKSFKQKNKNGNAGSGIPVSGTKSLKQAR